MDTYISLLAVSCAPPGNEISNAAAVFAGWDAVTSRNTGLRCFLAGADASTADVAVGLASGAERIELVVAPGPAVDDPLAGINLPAGCQNLGGSAALGYVRSRATPRADLDRMVHQREFLAALLHRVSEPSVWLNPWNWTTIPQAVAGALSDALSRTSIAVQATPATELSGFGMRSDMSDTLIVAISQSGTTTDTNRTVDLVRGRGATVLAIVNRRFGTRWSAFDPHAALCRDLGATLQAHFEDTASAAIIPP